MLRKLVTMRAALDDPALFGQVFAGASWASWRALLIAMLGEALTDAERTLFEAVTGREREPLEPVAEFWGVIGRRGGKTRSMAVLAAYLAACVDHRDVLGPGERGVLPLLAASTQQAGQAFNFVVGVFKGSRGLAELVTSTTADTLTLATGVDIEVRPASWRTIRGVTAVAAIADEIAFWRSDDSANPDREILKALRPALATTGGLLACISSPHAKRGELYATFKRHYGPDGDPRILVAKARARTMNPSLSQGVVDRAYEEDPEAAKAEYGGEFRSDLAIFISRETIDAAIEHGVTVRAPLGEVAYSAFADPSGGSSDSFTLAITHAEGERIVLDYIGERKAPFSPASAVEEFAAVLKMYRLSTVRGDRYAGEWPAEAFRGHGVTYQASDLNRSEIYLATLPLLNSGRVSLLDNQRMAAQFLGLERRTSRGGRDMVDHAPGSHDDVANSVAGALVLALENGKFDLAQWARVIAGPDEEASRDVPAALPWHPSKQTRERRDAAANPNGEGGALHDIYLETRHRYDQTGGFGKRSAENTCERCKQPIISGETRVTDGISAFHARCSPWPAR